MLSDIYNNIICLFKNKVAHLEIKFYGKPLEVMVQEDEFHNINASINYRQLTDNYPKSSQQYINSLKQPERYWRIAAVELRQYLYEIGRLLNKINQDTRCLDITFYSIIDPNFDEEEYLKENLWYYRTDNWKIIASVADQFHIDIIKEDDNYIKFYEASFFYSAYPKIRFAKGNEHLYAFFSVFAFLEYIKKTVSDDDLIEVYSDIMKGLSVGL